MCACEAGFVCSRCRETPWDAHLSQPYVVLSSEQFDELIADNDTTEQFDPSRGERWG